MVRRFQFAMHAHVGNQTDWGGSVKFNQYVDIAFWCFLASRKGAEEPSLQDGLPP